MVLIAAGCGLAVIYYFKKTDRRVRMMLAGIRVGLFLSLLCALIEPMLRLERLAEPQRVLPVLIDASASMRLFHPDSSVLPFIRSLSRVTKDNSGAPVTVELYCFGDSLRKCGRPDSIHFSDRQSFLPATLGEKQGRSWPACLIVSDGNFSNASLPRGIFQEKTCLYASLPPASPLPYLAMKLLSENEHAAQDSPSVAVLRVSGYSGSKESILLTCRERATVVSRSALKIDKGFYNDTLAIRLPTSQQGRFLYSLTAVSVVDTLRRALYFTQTVVSGRFLARIVTSGPSLDQRFLSLALENDPQWNFSADASKEFDAVFFIGFNNSMADAFKTLGRSGVAVFLGMPPCQEGSAFSPARFSPVAYPGYDSLFQQVSTSDLPPPTHLIRCPPSFSAHWHPMIGCRGPGPQDTTPFVSLGTFEHRAAIAVAGQDLWRLDFWPLSMARQSETGSFLEFVSALVKQQILLRRSMSFFAFPSSPEQSENDSIRFTVMLPSDFGEAVATGASSRCVARFVIDSSSRSVGSTGPLQVEFRDQFHGTVTLPPLAGGTYHYRTILEALGLKREIEDSLYVDKDREELSVPGQNTALLDQLSSPLPSNTVKAVLDAYAGASTAKRSTVFDYLEIRRSWTLLSVIFLLLTFEWLVRRKQDLE